MSEESKEISVAKPGYLSEVDAVVDNTDLNIYAKPPRIKIVQALTGPPVKPPFSEGDAVVIPHMLKIADGEEPFVFVPLHFFPSWICMNPIQMKGALKSIREFSLDPTSDLAKKCRSFVKEKCPENTEYNLQYRETLNFMVALPEIPDLSEFPIHMFFSSGEYTTGQKLIGDIQIRKAPRYACRFRAGVSIHPGKKGNWAGLDIINDSQPWVEDKDLFFKYKQMHEDLKSLIDSRTMDLDLEDVGTTGSSDETAEF